MNRRLRMISDPRRVSHSLAVSAELNWQQGKKREAIVWLELQAQPTIKALYSTAASSTVCVCVLVAKYWGL